ncbi:DUF427 domain-containing protein [Crocinitomix catalasitica]|uniref:DUF427 domain-containing protein n=1 Tax=Crocinitomix catalasitica TaxID=184607 RepID=UPI00048772B8|nr:DUF427 domain-containing protein [Crocinitomix catalasitica]
MKAIWNGQVIAESDNTINIEGNQYFPPSAIKKDFFKDNEMKSVCPWKGTASYYDVVVDGKTNTGAAWFYPSTSELAKNIEGYIAFWKGVTVEK